MRQIYLLCKTCRWLIFSEQ